MEGGREGGREEGGREGGWQRGREGEEVTVLEMQMTVFRAEYLGQNGSLQTSLS